MLEQPPSGNLVYVLVYVLRFAQPLAAHGTLSDAFTAGQIHQIQFADVGT